MISFQIKRTNSTKVSQKKILPVGYINLALKYLIRKNFHCVVVAVVNVVVLLLLLLLLLLLIFIKYLYTFLHREN